MHKLASEYIPDLLAHHERLSQLVDAVHLRQFKAANPGLHQRQSNDGLHTSAETTTENKTESDDDAQL